jgi:hypothetical protein
MGAVSSTFSAAFDAMELDHDRLWSSRGPFQGIAPGRQATPLGRIDLLVAFRTMANFRTKTLSFKVVGFQETYHTILGGPCYAKFKIALNYIYLKLKMLGPAVTINTGTTTQ